MSDSLWPHKPQQARPPCQSPTPGVHPNPCPSSRWCHPTTSSSVIPFSSHPQSFPASGSFQMSQLFAWGGQSIGVSASTSVLPMNTRDWFHLGWTVWISLQSKGLSRVFSNTTVQKHQFFGESRKIKSDTVSPSICHEVMGPDAMTLVFWMLSFKPTFSLSSFTFIKRLLSSSLSAIRVVSSAYLGLLIFLPAVLTPACAILPLKKLIYKFKESEITWPQDGSIGTKFENSIYYLNFMYYLWKRWEYQTTWPASWETCMQIRKQWLEMDMEQQTGSK